MGVAERSGEGVVKSLDCKGLRVGFEWCWWFWLRAWWFLWVFSFLFSMRKLYQDAILNMKTNSMSVWYTAVKMSCLTLKPVGRSWRPCPHAVWRTGGGWSQSPGTYRSRPVPPPAPPAWVVQREYEGCQVPGAPRNTALWSYWCSSYIMNLSPAFNIQKITGGNNGRFFSFRVCNLDDFGTWIPSQDRETLLSPIQSSLIMWYFIYGLLFIYCKLLNMENN